APWTNWKQVSNALPTSGPGYSSEPTGGSSSVSTAPGTSAYNYLPSSALPMTLSNTEGATSTSFWVTIDTAGATAPNPSGSSQCYRIRSTGQTKYPQNSSLTRRRSNNRLDNQLRNSVARTANLTSHLTP